jgi:hypothetical protein
MEQKIACVECRTNVSVPDSYADGDSIRCGTCHTAHRVVRTKGGVRLVIMDVTPLRENLQATEQRLSHLESELRTAQASVGIGANGLGVGFIYLLVKVAWEEHVITSGLIVTAIAIAIGVGILLEVANYLFLRKSREIERLTGEIAQCGDEVKELRRRIREATARR